LALGSNQGDRMSMLQGAIDELGRTGSVRIVAVSPVFETHPVGGPDQPDFLNAVVVAETLLSPRALLERALDVELMFGRERIERWGPRTLDIDLLSMDDFVVDEPDLTLPHPRAHERPFVLVPWAALDPGAAVPGRGPVGVLADAVDRRGVRARPDLELHLPTEDGQQ
jgi:2-amino-4-hydroxy-6-hydroxymethyldihydropteridine diphosphokinase